MSKSRHFRFFGTTPWVPRPAGGESYGSGTPYPSTTRLLNTCRIWWEPKLWTARWNMSATVGGVWPDGPSIGESQGESRGEQALALYRIEVGTVATCGMVDNPARMNATFTVSPDSVYDAGSLQYISMRLSGSIREWSGSSSNVFSSIRADGDFPCGGDGVIITNPENEKVPVATFPLFCKYNGLSISITLGWIPWDFED